MSSAIGYNLAFPMKARETIRANNGLGQKLIEGGRESVLAQSTSVVIGQPLRGLAERTRYAIASRLGMPISKQKEYARYFDPAVERETPQRALSDLPTVIEALGTRLEGTKDTLPTTPRKLYGEWVQTREALQAEIGEDNKLVDYILYRPTGEHVLFYITKGTQLAPLVIKRGDIDTEDIHTQLAENISVPLAVDHMIDPAVVNRPTPHMKSALAIESGIKQIQRIVGHNAEYDLSQERVDKISTVTNRVQLRRHKEMSLEGSVIANLVKSGASSVGEMQKVTRVLTETMYYDEAAREVSYDEALAVVWTQIQTIDGGVSSSNFEQFARETVYFQLITQALREAPQLVATFIDSGCYEQFAGAFKDRYLASYGQTEHAVAEAMLANYYLSRFEGNQDPALSPSQETKREIPDFHDVLGTFIANHANIAPPVPQIHAGPRDQAYELSFLGDHLKDIPQPIYQLSASERESLVQDAEDSVVHINHQRRRYGVGRLIMDKLEARFPLIADSDLPPTAMTELVGNLIMTRVPGEKRFTASSVLRADGYLAAGLSELQPFDELGEASFQSIEDSIRYIFNGNRLQSEVSGEAQRYAVPDDGNAVFAPDGITYQSSPYESQVGRLFEQSPVVLDFLLSDPRVPENIRSFMRVVGSEDLPIKLLEQYVDPVMQDPLIVNKFYTEGVSQFQTMLVHRYVTDFMRGVETELIHLTEPTSKRFKRKAVPVWENFDFSHVSDEVLEEAIGRTLAFGEHRINKLDNKNDGQRYMKDVQEDMEVAVLWDTFGMKFLRWQNRMTADSYLGYGWHCGCFYRKTIFNNTLPQY